MHVYQKFPCTIDSLINWPHKKVHENWMQLAVKILWLIKNNQGLLKYSLHSLNLQVYFSKNWLRNLFNLFNIFFAKRQQILGLRNDSSINPSYIYSWFLTPLSVLHSQFPTKKLWVVAYFFHFVKLFQKRKKKI